MIVYYDNGAVERQYTVITSQRGRLAGSRIVRGREEDCVAYYQSAELADIASPLRLASAAI